METEVEIYIGNDAHLFAKRKARYGHRDWIKWQGKDGQWRAARMTPETVKAAMLASGTQGHFYCYPASDGMALQYSWWMGGNALRQFKRGLR